MPAAIYGAIDTVLLGQKTYDATRKQGNGSGMPGMRAYAFSSTLREVDCPNVIVSDGLEETVTAHKARTGKDICLFGDGSLFRSLWAPRLVDSVEVAIIPVLLGGGLPLLPHSATLAERELVFPLQVH